MQAESSGWNDCCFAIAESAMLFQADGMAQSLMMCMFVKRIDAAAQHRRLRGFLAASLLAPCFAFAAPWGCHGPKPGHPTLAERAAFVREVSELAVKAEKTHGVPASALAAIAIAESG